MNYSINAEWHGADRPVAQLRCYGSLGCFDNGLQLVCIVGSHVSLIVLFGVQVRHDCWTIKHHNPMVIKPGIGTFGSVVGPSPAGK